MIGEGETESKNPSALTFQSKATTTMETRLFWIAGLATLLFFQCCRAWTTTKSIPLRPLSCSRHSSSVRLLGSTTQQDSSSSTGAAATRKTQKVVEVLQLARKLGPVGVRQSESDQQRLLEAARALRDDPDPGTPPPARTPLSGIHHLVYSASPGGSSGQLGPFNGKVTQEFVDDTTFINAVELGPLRIALTASRTVKNDDTIQVRFHKTRVSLFGNQVVEKEVGGGGAWKMIFVGKVKDEDGREKLVRIMETPSLFVIEQPL